MIYFLLNILPYGKAYTKKKMNHLIMKCYEQHKQMLKRLKNPKHDFKFLFDSYYYPKWIQKKITTF